MGFSFSHLVIILIIVLVVFGAGKMPKVMSDMGKGLKAFKDGVKEEEDYDAKEPTKVKSLPKPKTSSSPKKKPVVKDSKASAKKEKSSDSTAKKVAIKSKNKI